MSETKFRLIARKIEERIEQGEYPTHSKLPPHRIMADVLETTPTTIAKAYNLLADKGRVESFVGRGTFVKPANDVDPAPSLAEQGFDFSITQPYLPENLPFIKKAMEKVSRNLNLQQLTYIEHSGLDAHRQAAVEWAKRYGLEGGNNDNTLLTHGVQHSLSLLITLLTSEGDCVAVEAQTYPGMIALGDLLGRRLVGVKMDEQGMTPQSLKQVIAEHAPKVVIATPSFQNPTGATMSVERRQQIAQVVEDHQLWLIEDDAFGFLNPQPVAAISNFIPQRACHLTSLSKALSPSLNCGFLKAPLSLIEKVNAHLRANVYLSSSVGHATACELIKTGNAFKLASGQRELAQARQAIARQVLNLSSIHTGGYHIWLPLGSQTQAHWLVEQARKQNIYLRAGDQFTVSEPAQHCVRLSLMSVSSESKLTQGLVMLNTLLDSLHTSAIAS